jgi:glycosyltransferase involved in cell wall biosynthesis
MSLADISVVIIVRDAEETLGNTLHSLVDFGEVLIYDNGSTDKTMEIVKSFDNINLQQGEFLGFGKTKSLATSLARNDWTLSLDADEAVTDELRQSIGALELRDPSIAYEIKRHNYMLGKHVKRAGWGNDWLLRLFHRGHHGFNDAPVHEKVLLGPGGHSRRLSGAIDHDSVRSISKFLVSIDRYSDLFRHSGRKPVPQVIVILKTLFSFFRSYVLQLGLLEGWRGLIIAVSNANGTFYKLMMLLADQKVTKEQARK